MNKRTVVSAIRMYRKAFEYKEKMYKIIDSIARGNGMAYIEEMETIQYEAEQIIAEESGFNNDGLNIEDYNEYMRDITDMIKDDESEEAILAKILELRIYNNL